jgi:uncharacterized protein YcnI
MVRRSRTSWRDPSLFGLAIFSLALSCLALAAPTAEAHVGFAKRQVPLAPTIHSILRVPHGCEGSPTVRLRVRAPRVVKSVRPHAKDGWTVVVSVQGGMQEIAWSGRLAAGETGEFAFSFDLEPSAKAGDVLFFPVVQECEKGVSRWIDVKGRPSADAPEDEEQDERMSPAPALRLLPRP